MICPPYRKNKYFLKLHRLFRFAGTYKTNVVDNNILCKNNSNYIIEILTVIKGKLFGGIG